MDSEEEEEGNKKLLSKFSDFRHLSDTFRLTCHALRMSKKSVIISLTYFASSHFLFQSHF
jgi:hypothetical protein